MKTIDKNLSIHDWLMDRLSSSLSVPKDELDPNAPFSQYGLDSLDAVTLVLDIEEQLGIELSPTLLWDYPTVQKCVSYLVASSQDAKSDTAAGK